MTKETKKKIEEARAEKSEARTRIKFDKIEIKSYEQGWILKIRSEGDRYYTNLTGLFLKLFSIKLSEKRIDELQALYQAQKDCIREVVEVAEKLQEAIDNK